MSHQNLDLLRFFVSILTIIVLMPFLIYSSTFVLSDVNSFTVISSSMEPEIPMGSVIITKKVSDYSDLSKGDVITFRKDNKTITHRIYDLEPQNSSYVFITKGDNNLDPDPGSVSQDSIIGKKIFQIPYFGILLNRLRSNIGYFLLILVPAMLIIADEIKKIYSQN